MRHNVYGKHLGRDKNQRSALFKSLVRGLVIEEKIQTTESKSKAVKGLVDKLINQAKSPTAKRLVSQFLTEKKVYEKFMGEIVPRTGKRVSGYTSVVRLGPRLGDGAMMVQMSLLMEEKSMSKAPANAVKSVEPVKSVKSVEKKVEDPSAGAQDDKKDRRKSAGNPRKSKESK